MKSSIEGAAACGATSGGWGEGACLAGARVREPRFEERDVLVRMGEGEGVGETDEQGHVELRGVRRRPVLLLPRPPERALHLPRPRQDAGGGVRRAAGVYEVAGGDVEVCTGRCMRVWRRVRGME